MVPNSASSKACAPSRALDSSSGRLCSSDWRDWESSACCFRRASRVAQEPSSDAARKARSSRSLSGRKASSSSIRAVSSSASPEISFSSPFMAVSQAMAFAVFSAFLARVSSARLFSASSSRIASSSSCFSITIPDVSAWRRSNFSRSSLRRSCTRLEMRL